MSLDRLLYRMGVTLTRRAVPVVNRLVERSVWLWLILLAMVALVPRTFLTMITVRMSCEAACRLHFI